MSLHDDLGHINCLFVKVKFPSLMHSFHFCNYFELLLPIRNMEISLCKGCTPLNVIVCLIFVFRTVQMALKVKLGFTSFISTFWKCITFTVSPLGRICLHLFWFASLRRVAHFARICGFALSIFGKQRSRPLGVVLLISSTSNIPAIALLFQCILLILQRRKQQGTQH